MSKKRSKAELTTLEEDTRRFLSYLFAAFGNRAKSKIRAAWESGDYSDLARSEKDEQILQWLRNTHGPSWLNGLKPSTLEKQ